MKTGCDTCDTQGPETNTGNHELRNLHRALHDLGRACLKPWTQLLATLTRRNE